MLGAPAVLANYSRLFIDPNRHPGTPASIVEVSDGIAIPGNAGVDEVEAARRGGAIVLALPEPRGPDDRGR